MNSVIGKIVSSLISFIFMFNNVYADDEEPAYFGYANEITEAIQREFEKDFNLEYSGGGGSFHNEISRISMSFTANRRASIAEARALMMHCLKRVVDEVNSSEKIRPHLAEYPFPMSRVKLSISFERADNGYYTDGTVSYTFNVKTGVFYILHSAASNFFIFSPKDKEPSNDIEESYKEALEHIQFSPKTLAELRVHKEQPYEKPLDAAIANLRRELRKQCNVDLSYCCGDATQGIEDLTFLIGKYKSTQVQKAQELVVEITDTIVRKLNSDESLRPYIKNYPLRPEQLRVFMEFKKTPSRGYFRNNSISHILTEKDGIEYYFLKSTPEDHSYIEFPELIKKETYREASKAVRSRKSNKDSK
ncbi:MAG: hypothetical protein RLZZ453_792 [Chlamydiota bacterium]|jgi:hypothetical protein